MVVFAFAELVCPRVLLQEVFDCFFNVIAWVKRTCDGLTSEGVGLAISLYVFLDGRPLVDLTAVRDHGIFHKVEGNFTGQIIWNLENNAFIGGLDKMLQLVLGLFFIYLFVLLQIVFVLVNGLNTAFLDLLEL